MAAVLRGQPSCRISRRIAGFVCVPVAVLGPGPLGVVNARIVFATIQEDRVPFIKLENPCSQSFICSSGVFLPFNNSK